MERIYLAGYERAKTAVENMNEKELLEHIDILYGREKLPNNYTLEQLRSEALNQTALDFLNPLHPEYKKHYEWLK